MRIMDLFLEMGQATITQIIPTYIYGKDHCVQNSEESATLELKLPH